MKVKFKVLILLTIIVTLIAFPTERAKNWFKSHVKFLADDITEGRGPGSKGIEIAAKYIASVLEYHGVKPAFNGSYFQWIDTKGVITEVKKLVVNFKKKQLGLQPVKDFVITSNFPERTINLKAPLVFVGYGIKAEEYNWDDYKGVDVSGKILVFLVNDPPSKDPEFFQGKGMTYYGRWTYKYEEAERRGAIGALIIHSTKEAGYGWDVVVNSWTGEQLYLVGAENKNLRFEGWITKETARKIFKESGYDLDELIKKAGTRKFKPVELKAELQIELSNRFRTFKTANIAGIIEGTSKKDEYVVISAHYDHLGYKPEYPGEDKIFNGALDNSSGVAAVLILARLFAENPPSRSIIVFIPTLEESGLLGSWYFAKNPPVPKEKIIIDINIDGVNIWGEVKDFVLRGLRYYDLKGIPERVAEKMGLKIKPDLHTEFGSFFRSDHFPFAVEGIVGISLTAGEEYIGKPTDYSKKVIWDYIKKHYHKPSDEYREDWNLNSAMQEIHFMYELTKAFANSAKKPKIKPNTELIYWSKVLR